MFTQPTVIQERAADSPDNRTQTACRQPANSTLNPRTRTTTSWTFESNSYRATATTASNIKFTKSYLHKPTGETREAKFYISDRDAEEFFAQCSAIHRSWQEQKQDMVVDRDLNRARQERERSSDKRPSGAHRFTKGNGAGAGAGKRDRQPS